MKTARDKTETASCIGCGCDDLHACFDELAGTPCSWVRLDRSVELGVCSVCMDHVARWDAGDRVRATTAGDTADSRGCGMSLLTSDLISLFPDSASPDDNKQVYIVDIGPSYVGLIRDGTYHDPFRDNDGEKNP
jgi:hypothetical protein